MVVTFRAIGWKEQADGALQIVDIIEFDRRPGYLTVRNAKKMLRRNGDADAMELQRGRIADGKFIQTGRTKYTVF